MPVASATEVADQRLVRAEVAVLRPPLITIQSQSSASRCGWLWDIVQTEIDQREVGNRDRRARTYVESTGVTKSGSSSQSSMKS